MNIDNPPDVYELRGLLLGKKVESVVGTP